MTETDEALAPKRKASPSPPAEDAISKRVKLEAAAPTATNDGETPEDRNYGEHNGAGAEPNADGPVANGSELKHEQSDRQTHENDSNFSPRAKFNDFEAASRLSSEAKRPIGAPPSSSGRRNFSQEEKKRGQRLFGGLLSTLSQTTSGTSHWKKRQEIERRQQERAQQQRAEDEKRRAEKLAKLEHARKIDQVWFDEKVMRARHSDMLAMARNLHTNCEPRLYYRPWSLTREQETIIDDQVHAAKELIDRETQQFNVEKERRLRALGVSRPPTLPEATVGEPKPPESTNRPVSASSASKMHVDRDHDDNGEALQVDEEDTVLY